ncbi:MAG: F0F1 ATP synthase subunit epsilon [Deltaproteobacteria bacterium]|nr:F0F1 ATP synthase subunit epsilon [Deltaproteobacteria bacterium]
MSTESFQIRICTPAGIEIEEVASTATLPGVDGEVGILPNHCKYAGLLAGGVLSYFSEDIHEVRKMLISEGVCSFSGRILNILCTRIETQESLDPSGYEMERQDLLRIISEGSADDPERVEAAKQLRRLASIEELFKK